MAHARNQGMNPKPAHRAARDGLPAFVAAPLAWLPRLREFLGESFSGTDHELGAVVTPELFRQRRDVELLMKKV
jgi:hypothetical protein